MGSKLYVGGLPYSATESQLTSLFAEHGTVESARVIADKFTGQSRGFGFVEMSTAEEAKDRDESAEVYMFSKGKEFAGLAIIASEKRELAVVNIVGPVDVDKLARLEGQLGIPDLGIGSPKNKTKNDDEK